MSLIKKGTRVLLNPETADRKKVSNLSFGRPYEVWDEDGSFFDVKNKGFFTLLDPATRGFYLLPRSFEPYFRPPYSGPNSAS